MINAFLISAKLREEEHEKHHRMKAFVANERSEIWNKERLKNAQTRYQKEIAASLQAPLTRKLFQEEIANVALHKFREEARKPQMRTKKWVRRVKGLGTCRRRKEWFRVLSSIGMHTYNDHRLPQRTGWESGREVKKFIRIWNLENRSMSDMRVFRKRVITHL